MRTDIPGWDAYFMKLAYAVAERSKDPNTQVGAVIVDRNRRIVSTGYNGFAPDVIETRQRWQRPTKYDYVIHAEVNAIAHAASVGHATDNCLIYITAVPCLSCMKIIMAAGIKSIIADRLIHGWDKEHEKAVRICNVTPGMKIHINHWPEEDDKS